MKKLFILILTLVLPVSFAYAANTGGGSGGSGQGAAVSGSGSGDQMQQQDRDQIQDPSMHDGDSMMQDQDRDQTQQQDQDRIQDPTTHDDSTTTPDQDRDRDQDQDQDRMHMDDGTGTSSTTTMPMVRAQNREELRSMIEEHKQEFDNEAEQAQERSREVLQNQNEVRTAVAALLSAEDLIGGIGPQVSQIAQDFNNSVQATIQAEEQIQNRGRFVRFFVGGNEDAAQTLTQEANQNQVRIQEMNQLLTQCTDCDAQVKTMLQEQIQNMEREQERLQQVADSETQSKGLFDYLFGWLR